MHKTILRFLLFTSVMLPQVFHGLLGAEDNADSIEVIATGIGQDSDRALKNALRAAIEQAVGTLVDSETLAQNDEVVNDQILSYSAGFVGSHKVIGEPKSRDGLVTIKIQALVKRTQLTERLKAANIHVKKIDGESLFGAITTQIEQQLSGAEIIKNTLQDFPENIMEIKWTGKPEYDNDQRKLKIDVEICIDQEQYQQFVDSMISVLEKISISSDRAVYKVDKHDQQNEYVQIWPLQKKVKNTLYICTKMNEDRSSSIWNTYNVSNEVYSAAIESLIRPRFTIDIVDDKSTAIVSGVYDSPAPYYLLGKSYKSGFIIYPVLNNDGRTGYGDSPELIRPGSFNGIWTLEFDVSPNEIKQMRNVVCKIEKGN